MAETKQHHDLKQLAAAVGKSEGWTATMEAAETTLNGKRWIADVLLERDGRRVAVEVQWSPQSQDAYINRQNIYAASGVEVVWMHRTRRLRPSAEVMEGRVTEASDGGYEVFLEGYPGQVLPAEDFVRSALNGSLKFGFSSSDPVNVHILAAEAECWHRECDGVYKVIPMLGITIGNPKFSDPSKVKLGIGLSEIGRYQVAKAKLLSILCDLGGWEHVKERYSKTMQESYLSCGCPKCNRILGDHFTIDYIYDAVQVAMYQATMETLFQDNDFDGPDETKMWVAW
jgi:hypothetical protein